MLCSCRRRSVSFIIRFMRSVGYGWALALGLVIACGKSSRHGGDPTPEGEGGAAGESSSTAGESSAGGGTGGSNTGGEFQRGGAPAQSGAPGQGGAPGQAGAPPEAGAAGEGGDGPTPRTPLCDDGNDCTRDAFASGACRYDAVPDGARCDDGDACTLGDHCSAGSCRAGALQNGPGQALGGIESYGTGLALAAGAGRFVFVDSPASPARVTSTEVDGTTLKTLHRANVDPNFGGSFVGAAWDDVVALADGSTSYGLNGPSRNLQLFSLEADGSLTAHAVTPITPGSQTIPVNSSLAGRGDNLFLCHNWAFFGTPTGTLQWWSIANRDAPQLLAQGMTNGQCGSIALSEDATRVYVNTIDGVRWTDLSAFGGGDITFEPTPLVDADSGLYTRGDRLLVRTGSLLRVFDEASHDVLTTFSPPGAHAAALTDVGIFVQRDVRIGERTENFVGLYDMNGTLIDEVASSSFDYARDLTAARSIADGSFAMDNGTRRLFALSQAGMTELEAPELGAMGWAFDGTDSLSVRSVQSAHRVDVSVPTLPRVLAGGPNREPASSIELDVALRSPQLLGEGDPTQFYFNGVDPASVTVEPRLGHAARTLVRAITSDAAEHALPAGSFELPGGDAELLSRGDSVYRAAYATTGGARLQRYVVAELLSGVEAPVWEASFDTPAGAARSTQLHFDVDPRARVAALTTQWSEGSVAITHLYWIDLASGAVSAAEPLPRAVQALRVHGSAIAYSRLDAGFLSELVVRQRGDATERVLPVNDRVTRLLGFDGKNLHYALRNNLRSIRYPAAGQPLPGLNLTTRGTPISLTETAGAFVATTPGGLLTFAPACD